MSHTSSDSDASSDISADEFAQQLGLGHVDPQVVPPQLFTLEEIDGKACWTLCAGLHAARSYSLQAMRLQVVDVGIPRNLNEWIAFLDAIVHRAPPIEVLGQNHRLNLALHLEWMTRHGRTAWIEGWRNWIRMHLQATIRATYHLCVRLRNPASAGYLTWTNGPPTFIMRVYTLQNGHWVPDRLRILALLDNHAHFHLGPWRACDAYLARNVLHLYWLQNVNSVGRRPWIWANYFGNPQVEMLGAYLYSAAIVEFDLQKLYW
ncbi:hypothetical protein OF83DRAFT_1177017, partial [Amylostereum chailletii]